MIAEVLEALSRNKADAAPAAEASVRDKVKRLADRFPIYQN
jgi:hypothetical protein